VHVVQDGDHGRLAREIPEHRGQPLQQPRQRRLPVGQRSADDGHAVEEAGQIVEQPAAGGRHLRIRPAPQQRVDGLGPHPEGGGHPERVRAREHPSRLRVTREQFAAQPALAHSGLARQQNDAKLPSRGPGELVFQRGHLVAAAHQRQPGSWHQPDSGPAPGTDQGSERRPVGTEVFVRPLGALALRELSQGGPPGVSRRDGHAAGRWTGRPR